MRTKNIKITVEGPTNCGKSSIANAIFMLLAKNGFHVMYENPDGPRAHGPTLSALPNGDLSVEIIEIGTVREPQVRGAG